MMIASNKIYFLSVKTIPRVNTNLLVYTLNRLYFVDVVCDYLEKTFYSWGTVLWGTLTSWQKQTWGYHMVEKREYNSLMGVFERRR